MTHYLWTSPYGILFPVIIVSGACVGNHIPLVRERAFAPPVVIDQTPYLGELEDSKLGSSNSPSHFNLPAEYPCHRP